MDAGTSRLMVPRSGEFASRAMAYFLPSLMPLVSFSLDGGVPMLYLDPAPNANKPLI
jgi:hypothetical protein